MEILIRPVQITDAKELVQIYSFYVLNTPISFEYTPPNVKEFENRIQKHDQKFPWLTAEYKNTLLGYCSSTPFRSRKAYQWSVEVSVYIKEDSRGLGVGTQLYQSLFHELKEKGFHQAYAGVALPNLPSEVLHQKLGFKECGVFKEVGYKNEKWHDVKWFSLLLNHGPPNS